MRRVVAAVMGAAAIAAPAARAAYLIEVDTDGSATNGSITYSPDFSFGGDTTTASLSGARSLAVGLTGGNSIYAGNGNKQPDTYVFTHAPDSQADNCYLDAGAALGAGNYASGAIGGGPGRYAVYASWPTTSNVDGGPTRYEVVTAGSSVSFSIDQNTVGSAWVKLGEVDYTSGPITVTQTAGSNTSVSMRAAGVMFELLADESAGAYTGPPGAIILGEGATRSFGVAFVRNKAEAQANHFAVFHSTDMAAWSTTDLKLVSIVPIDGDNELVAVRSMAPMAALERQFLMVQPVPKMPLGDPPKYVAMTFDDGPHLERTPRLLDLLAARNIRATFYVLGTNAERHPQVLRRMLNEGHEIGNHTLSHARLTELSESEVIAEVAGCRDAVVAAATLPPATIRPPYGAVNDSLRALFLSEFGYPTVMWDVDPRDWDPAVSDQQVIDHILTQAGHDKIILCHDIHERTIAVMSTVLDGLLAQGFSFVTVTELLERREP